MTATATRKRKTEGIEIYPGSVHLPGFLTIEEQTEIVRTAISIGNGPGGWYRPRLRSGAPMKLNMACLGRHWNPQRYLYEAARTDYDGAAAPPLPGNFKALAARTAERAGTALDADVVILNHYSEGGRLGLHQDKDEDQAVLDAGDPIVSISIGDAGLFRIGGFGRRDPSRALRLESGDAFVFGGPSRLRFHGIDGIEPGSGPAGTGLLGRLNLTFRRTR